MSKSFIKVLGSIFLLSLFAVITYVIFANQAIDGIKDKINNAEKLWNNYYEITKKINSKDVASIATNLKLINNLTALNSGNNNNYSLYEQNIKTYASTTLSSEIDLTAIYSYNGNLITLASKSSSDFTKLNLSQIISRSLIGEHLALNIGIKKELYFVNTSPIYSNGQIIGVVLLGKRITESVSNYIKDLSGVSLAIISRKGLMFSSLSSNSTEEFVNKVNNLYKSFEVLNSKSILAVSKNLKHLKLGKETYLLTSRSLSDNNYYLFLLKNSPEWLNFYFILNDHMYVLIPLMLIIIVSLTAITINIKALIINLLDILFSKQLYWLYNKLNKLIDKQIDIFLNSILSLFKMDFINNNPELSKITGKISTSVKDYKNKLAVSNFSSAQTIKKMMDKDITTDCAVLANKGTILFSSLKDFSQLIEEFYPGRILTILGIYLKLQEEIIEKFEGTLIKNNEEAVIAMFNDSNNCVNAAIEIQNVIGKISKIHPEEIMVALSICTGEVLGSNILDQYMYFGKAITKAKDLNKNVPEGEIYLDKLTYNFLNLNTFSKNIEFKTIKEKNNLVEIIKINFVKEKQQKSKSRVNKKVKV